MTFLSDAERVWIRLKDIAAEMAADGKTPSLPRALAIVAKIIHEEHAVSTPDEARYYFAAELQRMVSESRMRSPVR